MNYKLIIGAVVLAGVIVLGIWFWTELNYNREELSNLPVSAQDNSQAPVSDNEAAPQPVSGQESAVELEGELNGLDLSGLDAEEFDLSGL
ncbi:MAG: hypothetical protein A3H72_00500 [Candidatus Doudnabacteria bacterium RIFCSPLOWO2_02_FULL_48_8]|uniref:Uncharacterized protein n=1 Tax=Candidatus Doudnabacteria bacterium RIFCSPHIGHO2_01_FULL_46_24 TaxID=1817825 RepID=A0A1F5NUF8_9BACT|nr:MAG: hypothetical protein A2720_03490 [Candidatus Doudnabacteria bacterium RIFCSPHIGHO2_01_FULL_46_24]OGE95052.1 MAG: hypothetical protein A3H72_00500 [Candidatus Doudnabacteria bacterium RIFCSPLOWO2_02_FULL_48_8]OGE95823.1 MAG: hypothetical protein A3E98_03330 [Candidatus Doudnabacteria bacterium RIFCSPHIGHO2_12_FULL_48_11]